MSNEKKKKTETVMGVKRVPGGWTVVEYDVSDGKIVATRTTEPDLRAVALETFLVKARRYWETE